MKSEKYLGKTIKFKKDVWPGILYGHSITVIEAYVDNSMIATRSTKAVTLKKAKEALK